jgi:hypothetical protein
MTHMSAETIDGGQVPFLKRPVVRAIAVFGALVAAAIPAVLYQNHSEKETQKTFESDREAYDEIKDVTMVELALIPWDKPDANTLEATKAVANFGDSIGENLTPLQWKYQAPMQCQDGYWVQESRIDLVKASTAVARVVQNMETQEGWSTDGLKRYGYSFERAFTRNHFGNVDSPGQAFLTLEQKLEEPSGIAERSTLEQQAALNAFRQRNSRPLPSAAAQPAPAK